MNLLKEALRRSKSITNTRLLSFNANVEARLSEMNDLPDPGLNDVVIITLHFLFESVIKSKLVRIMRKASLIWLRFFSLTNILISLSSLFRDRSLSSLCNKIKPRLFLPTRGISPINGIANSARSALV